MGQGGDSQETFRAEAVGWLAFLLFVALVYRLRQVLDRAAGRS